MSIGTDTPAERVLDNNSLADSLITLAALLRLNPQLPRVSSISISPSGYPATPWEVAIHPAVYDEEESIDAVRAFGAAFGPDAGLHLDQPRTSGNGATYRSLHVRAARNGMQFEAWAFIARTPAPDAA